MRADVDLGPEFFLSAIQDEYLENRLEAVIVLSEVGTENACNCFWAYSKMTTNTPRYVLAQRGRSVKWQPIPPSHHW